MQREEEKELGRWICHASHLFRRQMDRAIANADPDGSDTVSGRNFWVLRYLQENRERDVFRRDLENAFKVRRSTISKMVDLMEQKELIYEEPVNADARLKRLMLTEKAKKLLEKVSDGAELVEQTVRGSFSGEEYRTLIRLLDKTCSALEMLPEE